MTRKRVDAHSLRPHIVILDEAKGRVYPAGRMLVGSPAAIGAIVQHIPRGRVLRMTDLRTALATAYGADYTCPMTTGIYLRMLAESVEAAGGGDVTPWWRVVRDDGRVLDKLPGGPNAQRSRLEGEGHTMLPSKAARLHDVEIAAWTVTRSAALAARKAGDDSDGV
jgi:alkylated DNA nucleotide flippase Atl1